MTHQMTTNDTADGSCRASSQRRVPQLDAPVAPDNLAPTQYPARLNLIVREVQQPFLPAQYDQISRALRAQGRDADDHLVRHEVPADPSDIRITLLASGRLLTICAMSMHPGKFEPALTAQRPRCRPPEWRDRELRHGHLKTAIGDELLLRGSSLPISPCTAASLTKWSGGGRPATASASRSSARPSSSCPNKDDRL